MAEQARELRLSHSDMTSVFSTILALPRTHKPLHPSQQRSKYAELNQWLRKAMAEVVQSPQRRGRDVCQLQQKIMVALLQQLSELGRKECAQKGALLQSVKQYLVGTLNAYWTALSNANREVWYQFQHNSVRVEREYISELKRLQAEVEQLRKDKDHRWRNMFMLIKDNRIHRRQNRKLLTSISYEMEKNVALAEQMILLREENQKLKIKLACFENDPIRIQSFAETELKLMHLKQSIHNYPKRSKKILKNDLVKIQIQQINNLNDKIHFIIKAIQETGEIIDQFYDQENIWSNFHYNISTQTQPVAQDEKGTNTPTLRIAHSEASVTPAQLSKFEINQTYNLIIRGLKKQRKQTRQRQSRMPMFSSTFTAAGRFLSRREDNEKVKELASRHKLACNMFSICESVKMTIYNGRISYISTYNTEVFNGTDILRRIQQKIQNENKSAPKKQAQVEKVEIQVQTDAEEVPIICRSQAKQRTKLNSNIALPIMNLMQQQGFPSKPPQLKICQSVDVEINSFKSRSQHMKVKFVALPPTERESLFKTNLSDQPIESSRKSSRSKKRLHTLEQFTSNHFEREKTLVEKCERCTQTEQPTITLTITSKGKDIVSIANIESKDQPALTNPTTNSNNSNNSSFFQQLKNSRKNVKNKVFNQSMDSFVSIKPKSKPLRRSEISPLKNIQPKKMQKISRTEMLKHKRTSTENTETEQIIQNTLKPTRQFKMKPLHRISQVLTQGDLTREDVLNPAPVKDKILPLVVTRQGEIRSGDFVKGVEKIIRNMQVRKNQILSNSHCLKTYLSSYFKCLYGREIYPSFLRFLSEAEPQESVICFSRLANPRAPQPYLIDIFKGFVKAIGKCYVLGQSPCSQRLRHQVLKYLAGLFLQEQQINGFALRMRNKGCYTLMGWFNSLQQELWLQAIQSELYSLLSLWMNDPIDYVSYDFIEQLSYFMQTDTLTAQFLIKCKVFLGEGVPLHRFCLFSYRYRWDRMLQLKTSIQEEYLKRVGSFHYQEVIKRIQHHRTILLQFKHLERCFRQSIIMWQRYGSRIDRSLLMLAELNIQQYRLKNQMPLCRELKYLSLAFEALHKKKEFETIKNKLECGIGKENIISSKVAL